jgi:hypothetical protein
MALFHYLSNSPKNGLNAYVFSIKMTHFTSILTKNAQNTLFLKPFLTEKSLFSGILRQFNGAKSA